MSPAAVDALHTPKKNNVMSSVGRRSSLNSTSAAVIFGRRSPLKSPLKKSDSDSYSYSYSPESSLSFYSGGRRSSNNSPRSSVDSVDSPSTTPTNNSKRIRRPSCLLYSPVPANTSPSGKAMLSLQYEVRSLVLPEWISAAGNDQNSRDSGFESAGSTSSHRSTPVDCSDCCESVANNLPEEQLFCKWDNCPARSIEDGEILEHILSVHVQPMEKCKSSSTTAAKYACLWKNCKVYNKPSRVYAWLERHVVEKHGGSSRPYGCPVPGCRQRFCGRLAAERHINAHFEKTVHFNSANGVITDDTLSDKPTAATDNCRKSEIVSSVPSGKSREILKRDCANRRLVFERDSPCSLSTTNSTADVGVTPSFEPTECASALKKRNQLLKPGCSTNVVETDPLGSRYVRDVLAWRVALAMTNEHLAGFQSPCRKRNSGIDDQHNKRPRRTCAATTDVVATTTFQCKVLGRRYIDNDEDDDNCEYLVGWLPENSLPSFWMPKKMYKTSFTISKNLLTKMCS